MKNKFKEGEVVRAKLNPNQNLIVKQYIDQKYYCTIQENPTHKDLAYFESELLSLDIQNIGLLTSLNVIINK